MKNNHCFEDSARGDLLSQNPSLLYQYLASDVYPLTDAPFAEDVKKALDSGMNAHVAKPIEIRELSRLLEKYIG